MTAAKTRTRSKATLDEVAQQDDGPPPWAPWLTQFAFVLTLILLIARALMSETARDAFDVVPGTTAAPAAPGAASTVVLDALCCLPALLVLLRRVADRTYVVRWSWSHVLFGLLAIWSAISFAWSTDRFVTAIAAATTLSAAALIWSTAQLVRSWLRLRIVAGVCLGLLLAYTAQGLIYRFVQHPDDVAMFQKNRVEILRERGMEPDSFQAQQFERKFLAGEMIGFNQSPNSYAAVIVLLLAAAAGIAIQRAVGGGLGWTILIAVACTPVAIILYFTSSRTAGGTVLIAAVTLAVLSRARAREWLAAHSRAAYIAGVVAFLLGVSAIAGHGIAHGSLPQDSLNFRWRYWVAASRLLKEHPITGVGWANFGPHYLAVRLPAAAEEVRDPHNFIVRGFAELGIIGGVLVLAWLAAAAWELTRPIVPPAASATTSMNAIRGIVLIVLLIVGGILLNLAAAVDFSQPSAYLMLETFGRLLWAGLLFIGLVAATMRGMKEQAMDDTPARWVLYGLLVGLGVFFIHNLMDFVLMEPGPMTIFAIVLGAALGVRTPSAAGRKKRRGVAIGVLLAAGIAWLIGVVTVVIPIADAESRAQDGDTALRTSRPVQAAELYEGALRTVPWNADYAYRAARAWMSVPGTIPEKVKTMLGQAIAIDPANVNYHRTRAAYELALPKPDPQAVRADFDAVLRLDPRNLLSILDYAHVLETFGDPKAAAVQYRRALEVNEGYDKTEPKRLSPAEISKIEETIQKLN